eukprot:3616353-Rhodomonas_salina.3
MASQTGCGVQPCSAHELGDSAAVQTHIFARGSAFHLLEGFADPERNSPHWDQQTHHVSFCSGIASESFAPGFGVAD